MAIESKIVEEETQWPLEAIFSMYNVKNIFTFNEMEQYLWIDFRNSKLLNQMLLISLGLIHLKL